MEFETIDDPDDCHSLYDTNFDWDHVGDDDPYGDFDLDDSPDPCLPEDEGD